MKTITIVGLGDGNPMNLTMHAAAALEDTLCLVLRTAKDGAAKMLQDMGIPFSALDELYEQAEDFDALNEAIVQALLQRLEKYTALVYALPGNGVHAEESVRVLLETVAARTDIRVVVYPGIDRWHTALQAYPMAAAGLTRGGYLTISAQMLPETEVDTRMPLLVTQVDSLWEATQLKLQLSKVYGDEYAVYRILPAGVSEVQLYTLDHPPMLWCSDAMLYVPPCEPPRKDLLALRRTLAAMRGPGGSEWAMEQSAATLAQALQKAAAEVAAVSHGGDSLAWSDALGKVLLSLAMQVQLGEESGEFDLADVTAAAHAQAQRLQEALDGDESATR